MNVVLVIDGQVKIDDQRHLLNVNASSQKISGYQDTAGAATEFLHNLLTGLLVHVAVLEIGK